GTRQSVEVTSVRRESRGTKARRRSLRVLFRESLPLGKRRCGIPRTLGAPFLRVSCARVGFHDCRFRGQRGPPHPDVYYLVPPLPWSPGIIELAGIFCFGL